MKIRLVQPWGTYGAGAMLSPTTELAVRLIRKKIAVLVEEPAKKPERKKKAKTCA